MTTYSLVVNGSRRSVESWDPNQPLLYVLRNGFGLHGSKFGCGVGQCGACSVLIDGEPARSCLTPIASVARKRITTIEGLGSPDKPAACN
jgi:nicotinate dehydrogenase subunit A